MDLQTFFLEFVFYLKHSVLLPYKAPSVTTMIHEQKVLKYNNQIVFEKLTISSKFGRFPKAFQSNEACFMFVNKGEFSARTPDQFISFKKGQGILSKCFDYFFETNKKQQEASDTVSAIGVLLHADIIEEIFEFDHTLSNYRVNYNIKQVTIDAILQNYMESLEILIDNPEIADDAIIKNKLKEFVILLCKTQSINNQNDFLSALFKKNPTEFEDTIRHNLYSNLSVQEFALLCGMSVSSFKRKFNTVYNESPKKYFAQQKLKKASKMLKLNTDRISEIAYDCGFESISTFNRAFKSQYGLSPSQYRLNHNA